MRSCNGAIGTKGSHDAAIVTEKILPKLLDAAILRYFIVLPWVILPYKTPLTTCARLFWRRIIFAACFATEVPVSTEIPTSTDRSAGASLIPGSPKNPTQ